MPKASPKLSHSPAPAPPSDGEPEHLALSPAQKGFRSLALTPAQKKLFKRIGAEQAPFSLKAQKARQGRDPRRARAVLAALQREVADRKATLDEEIAALRQELFIREAAMDREMDGRIKVLREVEDWAARETGPVSAPVTAPADPPPQLATVPADPPIEGVCEALERLYPKQLHPQGVPSTVSLKAITAAVNDVLAADARKHGRPVREVRRDTVSRALGRRKG